MTPQMPCLFLYTKEPTERERERRRRRIRRRRRSRFKMMRSQFLSEHKKNKKRKSSHTSSPNDANANTITVSVWSQEGTDAYFKIKRTSRIDVLMSAYCEHKDIGTRHVRFLYKGRLIKGNQTVQEVGLKDGSKVDAMFEEMGGGRMTAPQGTRENIL